MPRTVQRFGWIPDHPDPRDIFFSLSRDDLANVETEVDLRDQFTFDCYDQLQLGSCTANAIAGAIEFQLGKEGLDTYTPSRLFIYYNERVTEGTVGVDSGATLRDGLDSVANIGAPPEDLWPYPEAGLSLADQQKMMRKRPTKDVYTAAADRKVVLYRRVRQQLGDMRAVLTLGFPFVFGFTVFESFMSDAVRKSGEVPMPSTAEGDIGGHAVLAVGYDDDDQQFIVRNSWGTKWGVDGYFFMPYAYLQSDGLARDFWTIQLVQ